jgi:hypothetical protein
MKRNFKFRRRSRLRREKQYRFSSNGTVVVRRDNAQERGAVAFDEGTKWPGITGEV